MTDECAAGSGPDSIGFDISGPGPHAIQPTSDLPEITTTMTIDGETDPQQIGLDGISSGDFGLRISGDGVVINDLTFVRWLYGMQIYDGADSVAVRNCRIGTNLVGDPGLGNSIAGIEVSGGASNTEISDSVISSSGQQGVRIQDGDTTGTTLRGNLIGTDPSGISSSPELIGGIRIHDATDTRIGGPDPSDSNVISGNGSTGILISDVNVPSFPDDSPDDTIVHGNLIGVESTGNDASENSQSGGTRCRRREADCDREQRDLGERELRHRARGCKFTPPAGRETRAFGATG